MKILYKVLHEPLLHFLLLGGILYGYYEFNAQENSTTQQVLKLSPNDLETIKVNFKNTYGVLPNDEQFKALKEEAYYEKILLNEADALGLAKQDKEIREILLKKMQFIMNNSSQIVEPTEKELYEYYQKNIIDYSIVQELSFSHIYFSNPDDENIQEIYKLINLADVDPKKAAYFSQSFKPSNFINNVNFEKIKEEYGKYFATKLFNLKQGLWHKPIHSKYGQHLIYVKTKKVSAAYPFDDIQERVYLDYKNENLQTRAQKAYKEFRSQYQLESE